MQQKQPTKSDLLTALKEAGVATKDDLKQFATKNDVREIVGEEIAKRGLATKDDLKQFATKNDLKTELAGLERRLKLRIGQERNKLLQAIGNLATSTPTLDAFHKLQVKVDRYFNAS